MKKIFVVAVALVIVLSTGSVNAFMHEKMVKELEGVTKQLEQQILKGQQQPEKQSQQQQPKKKSSSGDFQKGYVAYNRKDYATALREWTPLAEQGDANAGYNLAGMYQNGQGVPQNYETAIKWYTLAAEQGDAMAQTQIKILRKKISEKKKLATKQKKLTEGKKISKRGKWGIKFGMSSMDIEGLDNKYIKCPAEIKKYPGYLAYGPCEKKSGGSISVYYENYIKSGSAFDPDKCPCHNIHTINLVRGKYTNAAWKNTLKSLKKKYKIVKSPSAEEKEKFMYAAGEGDLEYILENPTDPTSPKYIFYITFGDPGKKRIAISYVTEEKGKSALGKIATKQKADDDL